jgi:hypothetical protein
MRNPRPMPPERHGSSTSMLQEDCRATRTSGSVLTPLGQAAPPGHPPFSWGRAHDPSSASATSGALQRVKASGGMPLARGLPGSRPPPATVTTARLRPMSVAAQPQLRVAGTIPRGSWPSIGRSRRMGEQDGGQ